MEHNKKHPEEELVDLMSGKKTKKKMSTAKKVIIIVAVVLLLLAGGLVWYVYSFLNLIDYNPPYPSIPGTSDLLSSQGQQENKTGVTNILLIGSDSRTSAVQGHSDSMIILSIDRNHQKIKMTSVMRDIYVPNITDTYSDRINTAYLVGGPDLMLATVNKNFDMQIDQYVIVNFQMFEEVVEKLGGVTLSVTPAEAREINKHVEGGAVVSAGDNQLLNGKQALAYARIRKGVGDDYARTDRQRVVLGQIINECKSLNVFDLTNMMRTILPHVSTNIPQTEILGYVMEATTLMNFEQEDMRLPVDGAFDETTIRGMAVLDIDFEKNTEALHEFIYEEEDVSDSTSETEE
ncbi:MAG: LCP family protein [Clostridiales bacterium]|nr:LCP family protein [Clostridiales bacterium]